MAVCELE